MNMKATSKKSAKFQPRTFAEAAHAIATGEHTHQSMHKQSAAQRRAAAKKATGDVRYLEYEVLCLNKKFGHA